MLRSRLGVLAGICGNQSQKVSRADDNHPRVITVKGTPFERGIQLWKVLGEDVSVILNQRRSQYSAEGLLHWHRLALASKDSWQKHAAVSWEELQGMLAAGAKLEDLLLLGTDFEQQMAAWENETFWANKEDGQGEHALAGDRGRCTAFALSGRGKRFRKNGICGQNVDEDPRGWDGGARDIVVRVVAPSAPLGSCQNMNANAVASIKDETKTSKTLRITTAEPGALVFTHPGVPGYCGMNSTGLCVLNLYISGNEEDEDEDEKEDGKAESNGEPFQSHTLLNCGGLPIDVTIRELLRFTNINDAVSWLQTIPRFPSSAAATSYLMLQDDQLACVECAAGSENRTAALVVRGKGGEVCHSNHALVDQRLFRVPLPPAPPPEPSHPSNSLSPLLTSDAAATRPGAQKIDDAFSISRDEEGSGGAAVASRGVTAAASAAGEKQDSSACPEKQSLDHDSDLDGGQENELEEAPPSEHEGGVHASAARLSTVRALLREATRESQRRERAQRSWNATLRGLGVSPLPLQAREASKRSQSGVISAEAAKKVLSACPCAHPEHAPTLASVVMEPRRGKGGIMHIRFGVDESRKLGDWVELPVVVSPGI